MIRVDAPTATAIMVAVNRRLSALRNREALQAAAVIGRGIRPATPEDWTRISGGTATLAQPITSEAVIEIPATPAALAVIDELELVAVAADEIADESLTTADELAFRRASAQIRHACRRAAAAIAGQTRRIPVISDEEATARLRRGRHRDSDPPATRPLMDRAGFPRLVVDDAPVAPVDDEPSAPTEHLDLGGEP